jgi:hypothetical protein
MQQKKEDATAARMHASGCGDASNYYHQQEENN